MDFSKIKKNIVPLLVGLTFGALAVKNGFPLPDALAIATADNADRVYCEKLLETPIPVDEDAASAL